MIHCKRLRPASLFSALFCLWPAAATSLQAATLPAGFTETKVAEGLNPTTMSFAPDGRLFLCEKQGLLRVITGDGLLPEPVLDLTSRTDSWNERGLLSVCFDPEFARNGWIYVYHTHNRDPDDKARTSSNNRVSRFTLKGNRADPGSERVILELTNLSKIGWHNGGGLAFGKDGKLYIATGENSNASYAQSGENLLGKLLRINKDGSIPDDNPHYKEFQGDNRAIAALGLRNPFSIAVQPTSGLLYLSMVGANFEQIEAYDSSAPPAVVNYGWPGIDGPPRNQPRPAGYRAPAHAYDHGRGDGVALCSGDFYNPSAPAAGAFPAEHTGRFFFSDYKGWIKAIDPAKPDTRFDFATGIDRPIDVDIAADGALWYIARGGIPGGSDEANTASTNGSVWRVHWTGGGQATRLAVIQQPADAHLGAPIGEVKIAVQDSTGKTIDTANDTITLTLGGNPAGAALTGTTRVQAVKGIASFSSLAIGKPGRGYSLQASSGDGLATAHSNPFDIDNQPVPAAITPPSGTFSGPVRVRISNALPGTTLRFTVDGKNPDSDSPVYTVPFEVSSDTTVKAIVQGPGLADSAVAVAHLKISGNTPYGIDSRPPVIGVKIPTTPETLPATLSATGIFTDKNLTPKAGVIPYSLNSPAWADGAETRHWVILPEHGKIGFRPSGEYLWPGGTIFIQHFEIVTHPTTRLRRRLETRLLVLDDSGGFGYGATYRWRPDGSDAELVDPGGQEEVLKITDASGTVGEQTWNYPASGLCFMCHTPNAGFVIGPKTRQLNRSHTYPGGHSDNQLRTWNYLQMFDSAVDESAIPGFAHTSAIGDASAPLEDRVRSYLDTNCAQCHRPDGTGASWDARFDTPLAAQGILGGEVRNTLGIDHAKIVAPGDVSKSILHFRMASRSLADQMPPVTRNVVDTVALDVLSEWIRGPAPAKDSED